MIGTLGDGLKNEFTPKVKKAWIKVFGIVEAQMKIGMRQAENDSKIPKIQQIEITTNTINENDLKDLKGSTINNSISTNHFANSPIGHLETS